MLQSSLGLISEFFLLFLRIGNGVEDTSFNIFKIKGSAKILLIGCLHK